MVAKARINKHPIHPMLVPFPIGLWIFSLAADIIYRLGGSPVWASVALYTLAGGIIGAAAAALPGFFDYFSMRKSRTKEIATWHLLLNVSALGLFIINFALRMSMPVEAAAPFVLSIIGVLFITVSGWLGGQMVYVQGAGVEKGAPQACGPTEDSGTQGARGGSPRNWQPHG
ncbi:MAG: DUF2231 domain-containing protein [Thermodesulfovibrionales bacterium]